MSAGTPVTTAGWFSPEAEPGKSGIRQRGNRALRHLGYVCRRGLPASLAVLQEETGDFASAALRALPPGCTRPAGRSRRAFRSREAAAFRCGAWRFAAVPRASGGPGDEHLERRRSGRALLRADSGSAPRLTGIEVTGGENRPIYALSHRASSGSGGNAAGCGSSWPRQAAVGAWLHGVTGHTPPRAHGAADPRRYDAFGMASWSSAQPVQVSLAFFHSAPAEIGAQGRSRS